MTMKTVWRMLGLNWTRLISDYLVSQAIISICIPPSYALTIIPLVTFCIHGDRKLVERSLICPQLQILTFGRFWGAVQHTFIHRIAWLCTWLYTDLHSNTVLPS